MKDQHEKIIGYRDLSQEEIDLMNEIKAAGVQLEALIAKVHGHIVGLDPLYTGDTTVSVADMLRWKSIARTDLQTGLMALTRAVARPMSF